jgi:hypothetical protein
VNYLPEPNQDKLCAGYRFFTPWQGMPRQAVQHDRLEKEELMINCKLMMVFLIVLSLVLGACSPTAPQQGTSGEAAAGKDPQNATYIIEGDPVTLVNGLAEKELAPDSASKQVTSYFGNEVEIHLNSDGLMDAAFLLTQDSGGSGTFYYAAAAINGKDGYTGTNAILLGDRISPQSTFIDPDNPAQFIVSYGEIPAGEPMSSEPTQMVSRTFKLEDGRLVEVVATPT